MTRPQPKPDVPVFLVYCQAGHLLDVVTDAETWGEAIAWGYVATKQHTCQGPEDQEPLRSPETAAGPGVAAEPTPASSEAGRPPLPARAATRGGRPIH